MSRSKCMSSSARSVRPVPSRNVPSRPVLLRPVSSHSKARTTEVKTVRAQEWEKEERREREEEQSRKKDMRSIDCHRKRGGMQGLLKRQGRFSTQDHGKDLWHAPPLSRCRGSSAFVLLLPLALLAYVLLLLLDLLRVAASPERALRICFDVLRDLRPIAE